MVTRWLSLHPMAATESSTGTFVPFPLGKGTGKTSHLLSSALASRHRGKTLHIRAQHGGQDWSVPPHPPPSRNTHNVDDRWLTACWLAELSSAVGNGLLPVLGVFYECAAHVKPDRIMPKSTYMQFQTWEHLSNSA